MDVSKDGKLWTRVVFPDSTPQEALDAIIGLDKSTHFISLPSVIFTIS